MPGDKDSNLKNIGDESQDPRTEIKKEQEDVERKKTQEDLSQDYFLYNTDYERLKAKYLNKTLTVTDCQEYIERLMKNPQHHVLELSLKLGLSGTVSGQYTTTPYKIESVIRLLSDHWLEQSLKQHLEKIKTSQVDIVTSAFQKIYQAFSQVLNTFTNPEAASKQFIESGDLLILTAGWANYSLGTAHSLGMALLGDRIIVTNTGEGSGSATSGTFILKLKNRNLITADFIDKISNPNKPISQEEFLNLVDSVTEDKEPIFVPAKLQKIGNCSFSNPKKNIKGILICLIAQDLYGDLDDESLQKVMKEMPLIINKAYKQFTNETIRDNAIVKLLELCNQCEKDMQKYESTLSDGLLELIKGYLVQHHDEKDLKRAKELYTNLPATFRFSTLKHVDYRILTRIANYEPPPITTQYSTQVEEDLKSEAEAPPVIPKNKP